MPWEGFPQRVTLETRSEGQKGFRGWKLGVGRSLGCQGSLYAQGMGCPYYSALYTLSSHGLILVNRDPCCHHTRGGRAVGCARCPQTKKRWVQASRGWVAGSPLCTF